MIDILLTQAASTTVIEAAAVIFAIAYLLLAVREHPACWAMAAVSTVLYLTIFWQVKLYMESALQLFYLAMAGYGWWRWRGGTDGKPLPISRFSVLEHTAALSLIAVMSIGSGLALSTWSDARLPFIDAFTTWASVVTTWMVARKVLENWHYWFVIDSVSIGLYLDRGLLFTALLFGLYLIIILFGYHAWKTSWLAQRPPG